MNIANVTEDSNEVGVTRETSAPAMAEAEPVDAREDEHLRREIRTEHVQVGAYFAHE